MDTPTGWQWRDQNPRKPCQAVILLEFEGKGRVDYTKYIDTVRI